MTNEQKAFYFAFTASLTEFFGRAFNKGIARLFEKTGIYYSFGFMVEVDNTHATFTINTGDRYQPLTEYKMTIPDLQSFILNPRKHFWRHVDAMLDSAVYSLGDKDDLEIGMCESEMALTLTNEEGEAVVEEVANEVSEWGDEHQIYEKFGLLPPPKGEASLVVKVAAQDMTKSQQQELADEWGMGSIGDTPDKYKVTKTDEEECPF